MKKSRVILLSLTILSLFLYKVERVEGQNYSLGVDLLLLGSGSLNLELSKVISSKITLHLPLSWNGIEYSNNKKLKHLKLEMGARWWYWHHYSSFFTSLSTTIIRYNGGLKLNRYSGEALGLTLSTGYAKMVSKRWNLELEGGVFLGWLSWDRYERVKCGEYLGSFKGVGFSPSKLSLKVIYLL